MALKIGDKAPDFTLKSTSGEDFHFHKDMKGKTCILYFYPKDFTSVCTAEACEFKNHFDDFQGMDIPVIGISRDSIKTHLDFKKHYQLPFDLLSDTDGKVCKAYKALVPVIGVPKRITYLIGADFNIKVAHSDMFTAKKHISAVLKELQG
jgi:thioredoxin-dependent peroxiredoxin